MPKRGIRAKCRRAVVVGAVSVALVFVGTGPAVRAGNDDASRHEIESLFERWFDAVQRADLDTLDGLIADDYVYVAPGQPEIAGKQSMLELAQTVFTSFREELSYSIREIGIDGNLAFVRLTESTTMIPKGEGPRIGFVARRLLILRREEGMWKVARDYGNFEQPPGPVGRGD